MEKLNGILVGFRTVGIALLVAIVPSALQFFQVFDWTTVVPAAYAPLVAAIIIVFTRVITTTPIFTKPSQ